MRLPVSFSPSSRHVMASLSVLAGCLAMAAPAVAQQRVSSPGDGRAPGMRYLTWPGKAEHPRPSAPIAGPAPDPRDGPYERGPILSMPSQPLVAPVATRYSARTSPGPTPASAWVNGGGAPSPVYNPTPPPTYGSGYGVRSAVLPEPPRGYPPALPLDAAPVRMARTVEAPVRPIPTYSAPRYEAPTYVAPPADAPRYEAPRNEAPPPAPVRREAPVPVAPPPAPMEDRRVPAAADTGPAAPAAPVVDPYAPRADAPIFRLLNRGNPPAPAPVPEAPDETAPQPAPTAAARPTPPPQAAPEAYPAAAADTDRTPRRYSVHRANGQSPDRVPLPDPVLLDSAPVDLAEPPATPTVVRNVNGRLTAITPASEDPALP